MKKLIPVFFAFAFFTIFGQAVYGCSCVVSSKNVKIDFQKWAKKFDGKAFSGKVIKIETDKEKYESKVTFAVDKYWRGDGKDETVIYTPSDSGMCGVNFNMDETYTVIADRSDERFTTYLCPAMVYAENREEYLKALGEGQPPESGSDLYPRKFDEFANTNCEDELARLDAFAVDFNNYPTGTGYIIVYGGKKGKRNEAKAYAARMMYYLVTNRYMDPARLITIDGGYREKSITELWIWRPGESKPAPAPTVKPKDVRLRGKAKIRRYNCGSEMGND